MTDSYYEKHELKIGDLVSAAGKPGVVVEVLKGTTTTCFRLKSPDLIARRQNFNDYSEIIELQYYVKPTSVDDVIKHIDMYIGALQNTISNLEQFKEELNDKANS